MKPEEAKRVIDLVEVVIDYINPSSIKPSIGSRVKVVRNNDGIYLIGHVPIEQIGRNEYLIRREVQIRVYDGPSYRINGMHFDRRGKRFNSLKELQEQQS